MIGAEERILSVHLRSGEAIDLLCVTAGGGTLGFAAADVSAIHDVDGPPDGVPRVDLAALLGPGGGVSPRRIRVVAAAASPFDVVTDGALSVRSIARSALQPVPRWLAPFCARLGVDELALDEDVVVLLVDPRRLRERCSEAAASPTPAVPRG